MGRGEEERERPRPRVVDKRGSARAREAPAPVAPTEPAAETRAGRPPPPEQTPPAPHGAEGRDEPLWTPEQEAEARRFAQQVVETPSRDWVLNTAVTLANVAAAKLEAGAAQDARLAIDALSGLINAVGSQLGDAEAPLRQTVAQLQLSYAQGVGPAPG
jgi:hypothetical protein